MSDASFPHCEKCQPPEYACTCADGCCVDCGCELDQVALEAGRDMCFECYVEHQG
jgi:hypothetical protein